MRINPETIRTGVTRAGQPLYVAAAEAPGRAEEDVPAPVVARPVERKAEARKPRGKADGGASRLPTLDELDLPVLTEEDLKNWGRVGG